MGKKATYETCFATLYPELILEWHPRKNAGISPYELLPGSHKKVWWICKYCNHEWDATIYNRAKSRKKGSLCPVCSQKVKTENMMKTNIKKSGSLLKRFPRVSELWHPKKNGDLTPNMVAPKSNKSVWWFCDKGERSPHEWETPICNMILVRKKVSFCPFCNGKRVCLDNCLATTNPTLALQWHPNKNGALTPFDVTSGTNRTVWWQCDKGHSSKSTVKNRSNGNNCSVCTSQLRTSFAEQAIFYYLKSVFKDALNGKSLIGIQGNPNVDVYIDELKLAVEYDGVIYHKRRKQKDIQKNKILNKNGIKLIRIRENGLPILNEFECLSLLRKNNESNEDLNWVINLLIAAIKENIELSDEAFSKLENLVIDIKKDSIDIYNNFIKMEQTNSLAETHPLLASQWHPTKNGMLRPIHVTQGSEFPIWWICEFNHTWQSKVYHRSGSGSGCPYCSGRYATNENNLEVLFPEILEFWHPSKNLNDSPYDIKLNSTKLIWLYCDKGILAPHEWEIMICDIQKPIPLCPFCTGKRIHPDNCLATLFPNISKEWHYFRNNNLTPYDVRPQSNKIVWWVCENGHEHQKSIQKKYSSPQCRECLSISYLYPVMALEWNTELNGHLTPNNTSYGSEKLIWWRCGIGHEWYESPNKRTGKEAKGSFKKCRECYLIDKVIGSKSGLNVEFGELVIQVII